MKTTYAHQNQEDQKLQKKLIQAPTVTIADNQVLAKPDQEELDKSIEEKENEKEEKQEEAEKTPPFHSENAGWKRVFSYYKP